MLQGHPVGLLGEEGGATTGTLSDGVSGGIESSEHHNPPEMLDGLDGKTYKYLSLQSKLHFRFHVFP